MISPSFENTIKDELRLHYDINLCSLVEVASHLPFYKDFKAQFFKCLLIHINSEQYNEADYLNLNYDDIKKYFLVLEMNAI